jgi:hypothetical protein
MSTRVKVLNGTRSLCAPRLCDTCQSGIVRRGPSESNEEIYCTLMKRNVEMRVVECSRYVDRSRPSLWDMRQIASVLQTDSKRQKIGFLRAKEWERKFEDEELLPNHLD